MAIDYYARSNCFAYSKLSILISKQNTKKDPKRRQNNLHILLLKTKGASIPEHSPTKRGKQANPIPVNKSPVLCCVVPDLTPPRLVVANW